jgi:hypothetical protein
MFTLRVFERGVFERTLFEWKVRSSLGITEQSGISEGFFVAAILRMTSGFLLAAEFGLA